MTPIKEQKIKTSLALNPSTIQLIDEYRATLRPIPSKTETIEKLILQGLNAPSQTTQLPKPEKIQSLKKEPDSIAVQKTINYANKLKDALSKPL